MENENEPLTTGKIILTIIYLLIFPAMLILLPGDWMWIEGWIFGIWFMVLCLTVIFYLYRNDPSLLKERYKKPEVRNFA